MRRRREDIHSKGFSFVPEMEVAPGTPPEIEFGKIRVGLQTLDDAVLDLGTLKQTKGKVIADKGVVIKALWDKDYPKLRELSNHFFEISGIYERLCKYFAYLYRYDWYVTPYVEDDNIKEDKILTEFSKVLNYLDNSNVKYMCGNLALKVIKNGVYYGYIIDANDRMVLQDLPIQYCRTRYDVGGNPGVEMNMKFFDDKFGDPAYRIKVLKMFPEEIQQGYVLYKKHRLVGDPAGSGEGWYILDPEKTVKLTICDSEVPLLVNIIPAILDLDEAQDLDRRKTMQQLLKIVIQKLPLDKNGDLLFDVDEAKDIHNNAVQMLKRAVGVDVMTTFADVDVANMADKNTSTTTDDLERVERQIYNAGGTSQKLFNADSNIALNAAILNDEASIRNLIQQFGIFLNKIVRNKFPGKKKYNFQVCMLETTIYNYLELAKMFKEQVQIGYSKMLPQIALGLSQSSVIATAHFENEILHLYEIMIPPLMSSTMNGQDILGQKNQNNSQNKQQGSTENTGGRPEKPDSQKSDKTIANKEASNGGAKT